MAILHRFLLLLEFLDRLIDIAEASADSLTAPVATAAAACLLSYQALLLAGCDVLSSAVLSSAIALALNCGFNHPNT
ncbi:MAG: hypothetical protein ACFB5Z_04080 [Elainellaceae cyanobacterium]